MIKGYYDVIKCKLNIPTIQPKLQMKEITPSTEEQYIIPDEGYDGLASAMVKAVTNEIDPNILPENIRLGKSILGISGNLEPDKPDQSKTVIPTTEEQTVRADEGYELASVRVKAINLQNKEVTITENGTTTVTPDTGYDGLSDVDVTVSGILDTSDATATADDIGKNKTAYVNGQKIEGNLPVTDYLSAEVNISTTYYGGVSRLKCSRTLANNESSRILKVGQKVNLLPKLSDVASAIGATPEKIAKGEVICDVVGTYEGSEKIEMPENDVNFYDYDGERVASYSKADFLALNEMPANPSHQGLTAQGWNWSLEDAKSYVTDYGMLNIGQMYVTDDGKTRVYIELNEGRLEPYLGIGVNGTAIVDWGDNTTSTLTGSNGNNNIYTKHIYSKPGKYIITIHVETGSIQFNGEYNSGCMILTKKGSNDENRVYRSAIKKIELGIDVTFGFYCFQNCNSLISINIPNNISTFSTCIFQGCNLTSIVIPNSINDLKNSMFNSCIALSRISLPNSITNISNNVFMQCTLLRTITLPNSITNMGTSIFQYCYALTNIKIPNNITKIPNAMFAQCYGAGFYDFRKSTSIPTMSSTNAFTSIPSDCKIIVPDELYDDWIVATNWSTYASRIVKASEA